MPTEKPILILQCSDPSLLQFFLATIIGQVFDTYGARLLLVGGTILITLSLMLTSIFSQYYQLMICHGVIFGIGSGMLYNPGVSGNV
jgi:MFS family permease